VIYYLLDFYEEPSESSQSVFNTIISAIKSLGLDILNITTFDTSVDYGKNCSVFEKLKNKKSNFIEANCNCHEIHNAAKHSMKVI
jgi:hypothetical protein